MVALAIFRDGVLRRILYSARVERFAAMSDVQIGTVRASAIMSRLSSTSTASPPVANKNRSKNVDFHFLGIRDAANDGSGGSGDICKQW